MGTLIMTLEDGWEDARVQDEKGKKIGRPLSAKQVKQIKALIAKADSYVEQPGSVEYTITV